MARKFEDTQLIVASHNPGKVVEIGDLIRPFNIRALSAGEFGLPEPEETGDTFKANAELKALSAATLSRLPALADDSGLCVEALGGDPGIFSARWGGPDKDFNMAMRAVEDALQDEGATTPDQRRAYFACALSLAWPDGHVETFEGQVHGQMVWPGRGSKGFGYDPVFQADGYDITFGEMDPDEKHGISHRANAFQQLIAACFGD